MKVEITMTKEELREALQNEAGHLLTYQDWLDYSKGVEDVDIDELTDQLWRYFTL